MFTHRIKLVTATACAAVLTACGGGGVDVSIGSPIDPGPGVASVADAQAFKVTSASIAGGPMSLLIPVSTIVVEKNGLENNNLYTTLSLNVPAICTAAGGNVLFSITDADNSRRFSPGDLISLAFTNCALSQDGSSYILNGTLEATTTETFRGTDRVTTQTFTPRNLSATVRGVAATYNGSISIEIVRSASGALISSAYVTNLLEITFAGGQRTDRISNARWGFVDDTAAGAVRLFPNQNVTLFQNGVVTAFSVTTVQPMSFRSSDNLLVSGQLSILHPRDTVRVTVTGLGQLEIAIDYNSGGLYDRFLNINALDLLNGWN